MKNILFVLITLLFIGCNSKPSESDAREVVKTKISEISQDRVELIEFKKVNAQELNFFGVDIYEIEYEGKIKYKESGKVYNSSYKRFAFSDYHILNFVNNGNLEVIKDEVKKVEGSVTYQRKENGWEVKALESLKLKE